MKNIYRIKFYISLISIFFFFSLFNILSTAAEELILITDDWPPYMDRSKTDNGFLSEIVVRSFGRVGINAKIEFKSWARIRVEVSLNNKIAFGYVWDEINDKRFSFSDEIIKGMEVFAVRADSDITWKTYDDLIPYIIGTRRGFSYGRAFEGHKGKLNIRIANTEEQNIDKLLQKVINLSPVNYYSATLELNTKYTSEQQKQIKLVTNKPIKEYGLYLICSKKNKKGLYYIKKFNKGLSLITQDGTKQSIIDRSLHRDSISD